MVDGWVVCFLAGMIASLSATEMVRVAAVKLSAVDHPGGRRAHRRPTPRLGGLGIIWGFGVALAVLTHGGARWEALTGGGAEVVALLAGAALLACVGLADDRRGLPWSIKLGASVLAGLALYAGGWRAGALGFPGLGSVPTGAFALPLTVLWVVVVTNAINLIDGLDGLATGVALVATLGLLVLPGSAGPERALALALAGALLGFLWFNLHPALIFMGDAGSLFVGFVLAALTLRAGSAAAPDAFPLVPILVLALPLADTTFAIARRGLAATRAARSPASLVGEVGRRVFAPDRGHVHHLLLQAGFSQRRSVALLWAVAASFAFAGWLTALRSGPGLVVTLAIAGAWSLAVRRIGHHLARRAPAPAASVEPAEDELAPPTATAA
jgi:UDP-GlcNAc:undecaprenyl-phosphate GlcNAc-1-phosphate transferase